MVEISLSQSNLSQTTISLSLTQSNLSQIFTHFRLGFFITYLDVVFGGEGWVVWLWMGILVERITVAEEIDSGLVWFTTMSEIDSRLVVQDRRQLRLIRDDFWDCDDFWDWFILLFFLGLIEMWWWWWEAGGSRWWLDFRGGDGWFTIWSLRCGGG